VSSRGSKNGPDEVAAKAVEKNSAAILLPMTGYENKKATSKGGLTV